MIKNKSRKESKFLNVLRQAAFRLIVLAAALLLLWFLTNITMQFIHTQSLITHRWTDAESEQAEPGLSQEKTGRDCTGTLNYSSGGCRK